MAIDRRRSPGTEPRPLLRLDEQQVEQFFDDGYLTALPIFDAGTARDNAARLDDVKRALGGQSLVEATYCQERCQPYQYGLAANPVLLDHVEDILGPDFFLWCSHIVCKEPYEPRPYTWHQDSEVAPIELDPARGVHPDLPVSLTVWLALDDSDHENGAVEVIPGSHRRGRITHIDVPVLYSDDLAPALPPGVVDPGEAVTLTLKAGEACMFHDRLFHGSGPNRSGRRRAGLALHYSRTEARIDRTVWPNMKVRCVRGVDRFGLQPTWSEFEPGPIDVFAQVTAGERAGAS